MDLNKLTAITLYFTAGNVPTEEETNEAREIARAHMTKVRVRNGAAPISGGLEKCDYVAGKNIPNAYALAYPKIGEGTNEATTEPQPAMPAGTEGSAPGAGEGSQPSASSLASEVGSVSGGWGTTT